MYFYNTLDNQCRSSVTQCKLPTNISQELPKKSCNYSDSMSYTGSNKYRMCFNDNLDYSSICKAKNIDYKFGVEPNGSVNNKISAYLYNLDKPPDCSWISKTCNSYTEYIPP